MMNARHGMHVVLTHLQMFMAQTPLPSKASPGEPRSLLRILGIFEAISRARRGVSLAELSAALEAPKSSLLLILRPMVAHKFLVQVSGRYELGPSIFRLSAEVLASAGTLQIVRPFLEALAERTNESVYLAAIDKEAKAVTYVDGIESRQPIRYSTPIGTTRPLYGSSAGKALLAFQDEQWVQDYLKTVKLKPLAEKTPIKKAALLKELEEIQKTRVALNLGGLVSGAAGIASPLVKADGTASYALLVVAPTDRLAQAVPELKVILSEISESASHTLAHMPGN